jgi:hypothetical protein
MTLAAVKESLPQRQSLTLQNLIENEEHFHRWVEHPASIIIHHEAACCEEARLWFLAYARSMEVGASTQFQVKAPAWLMGLFDWGPSKWPISWCEVVKEKTIDCGAFAALAREVFQAQGHEAFPAQALLSYNRICTEHWQDLWKGPPRDVKDAKDSEIKETFPWVGDEIVYHEICVIERPDGTAIFYDSTFGQWYLPETRVGFGALLAVRSECPRLLDWNGKSISCGEWVDL